jgi:YVTN family beta-propeller protein
MFRRCLFASVLVLQLLPSLIPAGAEPPANARTPFKSPLGLAVDEKGQRAYVALHDAGTLAVVDLKAGKVLHEVAVGKGPWEVALQGNTAWVTCELDDTLVSVDLEKAAVQQRTPVGQAPRGLAVMPDGSRVYLACRGEGVDVFQTATKQLEQPSVPTPGIERLQLAADGKTLFFPIPLGTNSMLARLNTSNEEVTIGGPAELPETGPVRGRSLFPADRTAIHLIIRQKPRTRVPTTQVTQGWIFTNVVAGGSPDAGDNYLLRSKTVPLDEPNRGYADPVDQVTDGKRLFVACAGADHVLVLDRAKVLSNLAATAYDTDDLTASRKYVVAHLDTQANPRRLALSGDGKTLVVSNYLADSLTVVDAERLEVVRHIPLGGPGPAAARRGEILFNSAKMTFQGQFTCASCHPGGETDNLTWDLTRDGVGNFKNTKSLLGVKDTAPYGWHGSSATLADRVAGTLRTLHRHEPQGSEVEDIVAYLETLPPPRPLPQTEADKPAIARGRTIFQEKGQCTACHQGDALEDGKQHDVGTRGEGDTQDRFDTPSLRGVARTAPYLHDGRAITLEDVFTKHNAKQRHGAAHLLSKEEMGDLVKYLRSL